MVNCSAASFQSGTYHPTGLPRQLLAKVQQLPGGRVSLVYGVASRAERSPRNAARVVGRLLEAAPGEPLEGGCDW